MRYTTYESYRGSLADALNLQALLERLSDFLLDSGFAGPSFRYPFPGDPADADGGSEDSQSMDALRDAILRALMESGELDPEMLEALRGRGDPDPETVARIARLLDDVIDRLMNEGYLRADGPPRAPGKGLPLTGPGSIGRAAAGSVSFELTRKGLDFLSHRALQDLLGALGRDTLGLHETRDLATGVEAELGSKPYEFGDTLNLDVAGTLREAFARAGVKVPIDLEYGDLRVHQATRRSRCATVLMLDCSHSMILYGEDRFTPAKKVVLALAHLIRTRFPGDRLRCVLFHDSAEEIPLPRLASAKVGPYHTNTAEGLRLARRLLRGEGIEMRQIVMVTDGKPSAASLPDGRIYKNSMGLDRFVLEETFAQVTACRREGVSINTFMLARNPQLVEFVRKMTEIARGRAYFTTTLTLGQYILMDYLRRRTKRIR